MPQIVYCRISNHDDGIVEDERAAKAVGEGNRSGHEHRQRREPSPSHSIWSFHVGFSDRRLDISLCFTATYTKQPPECEKCACWSPLTPRGM
jgi:hypothetical protein